MSVLVSPAAKQMCASVVPGRPRQVQSSTVHPYLVFQNLHRLQEPLRPPGAAGKGPRRQLGLLGVSFLSGAAIGSPLRGMHRLIWAIEWS